MLHILLSLAFSQVLQRGPVNADLDAVVTLEKGKLILRLQSRGDPNLVYFLGSEPAILNCVPKVERISVTDVIGSCEGENYAIIPNWKFLFDSRAKALVSYLSYMPFSASRVFATETGAVFLMDNTEEVRAVEYQPSRTPPFRVMSEAEAKPLMRRVHILTGTVGLPPKQVISIDRKQPVPPNVPIPPSTYDQFEVARPGRVKDGYVRASAQIHDSIGPWTRENALIWFGKSFYDGEGETGIGGFGYMDPITKRLMIYAPPEIVDYSVSAMFVTPENIWMGLFSFGELSSNGGGILRFNRATETVEKLALPEIAFDFARFGDQVLAGTSSGIAVIEHGKVHRFFLDRMSNGHWRVVEASFP